MTFCKCIKKVIKNCDCFGTPLTFRINNDLEYKSLIGGISTILFTIVAGLYISYMSYRFLWRKDFDFIYSNKIVDSGANINLTEVKFNLAFGIQFTIDGTNAINTMKKYMDYSMTINQWNGGTDNITYYRFDLANCNLSDFHESVNTTFHKNKLYNMYCPVKNETTNYTLDGLYTDSFFKFIEIKFTLNEYAMTHLEETEEFFYKNPIEMIVYFLDTAIDYESRTKPISLFINMINKWLDFSFVKETAIYISPVTFSNDENIIVSHGKVTHDCMYDYSQDAFKMVKRSMNMSNILGTFIIKSSSKIVQFERNYRKLPTFIADLQGIIEEILLFIFLIVNYIEIICVDKKLIQNMLKYKGSKYYDIEYLTNVFKKNRLNLNITSLIEKDELNIQKTEKIVSKRNSVALMLDTIKHKNTIKKDSSKNQNYNLSLNNNNNIYELYNSQINQKKQEQMALNQLINNDTERPLHEIETERPNKSSNDIFEIKNSSSSNQSYSSIEEIPESNLGNEYSSENKSQNNSKKSSENKNSEISSNKSESKNSNSNSTFENNKIKKYNFSNHSYTITKNNNRKITNKFKKLNSQTNDSFIEQPHKFKKKKTKKELYQTATMLNDQESEEFGNLSVSEILITKIFFCCSKKIRKKKKLFDKCEERIYYYLDIFVYSKKMQEIDLLKYSLFDDDQFILFKYLSTPPIKLSEKNIGLYKEFQQHQSIIRKKMDKNDVDELFEAYKKISEKEKLNFEDIKLLRLINAEIDFLN